MKSYRIYVYNEGVYHYQKSMTAKLAEVLEYCNSYLSRYGGYIKNYADNRILRKF